MNWPYIPLYLLYLHVLGFGFTMGAMFAIRSVDPSTRHDTWWLLTAQSLVWPIFWPFMIWSVRRRKQKQ